jgi:hypothetical protein
MSGLVVYTDIPNKSVFDTRQQPQHRPQQQVRVISATGEDAVRAAQMGYPAELQVSRGGQTDGMSCPGCWGSYSRDGQMPKTLDCSHIVCARCIQTHVTKNGTGKAGRKYPCPLCQEVTSLPKGGARDMNTHRVTLEQVDVVSARKKKAQQEPAAAPVVIATPAAVPIPLTISGQSSATAFFANSTSPAPSFQINNSAAARSPVSTTTLETNSFYQMGRAANYTIRTTIPQAPVANLQIDHTNCNSGDTRAASSSSSQGRGQCPDDVSITRNAFYQMGANDAAADEAFNAASAISSSSRNNTFHPLSISEDDSFREASAISSSASSSSASYAPEKRPPTDLRVHPEKSGPFPRYEYEERDLPPPYSPTVTTPAFSPTNSEALYPALQRQGQGQGDRQSRAASIAVTADPNNPHMVSNGGVSYWRMFPQDGAAASDQGQSKGGEGRSHHLLPPSIMRPTHHQVASLRDSEQQQSNSNPNISTGASGEFGTEYGAAAAAGGEASSSAVFSTSQQGQRRNSLPDRYSPPQTEEASPQPPSKTPNLTVTGMSFITGFGSYGEVKMKGGRFRRPTRLHVSDTDEILVVDEQYAAVHVFNAKFEAISVIQMPGVQSACFFGLDKLVAATSQGVQVVYTNGRLLRDLPIGACTAVSAYNLGFIVCQTQKLIVYSQVIEVVKETSGAKSGKIIKSSRKFKNLSDVSVSKDNKYVAVLDLGMLEVVLMEGASLQIITVVKAESQACGPFKNPCSIAVDARGSILVVDRDNGRLLQFGLDGVYKRSLLTTPAEDLAVAGPILPRGVAIQNPDLVVVTLAGENFAQVRVFRMLMATEETVVDGQGQEQKVEKPENVEKREKTVKKEDKVEKSEKVVKSGGGKKVVTVKTEQRTASLN